METREVVLGHRIGPRTKIRTVRIPTDAEIVRIAERLKGREDNFYEQIDDVTISYRTSKGIATSLAVYVRAAGETLKRDWEIVLRWENGDDAPPVWHRYEDKIMEE